MLYNIPNESSLIMCSGRVFMWFRAPGHRLRKHFRRTWRGKMRKRAIALTRAMDDAARRRLT